MTPLGYGFEVHTRCVHCGQSVELTGAYYQRVTGWERPRSQGGTNAIALREPLMEFMHVACMEVRKAGGVSRQESLDV